MRVSLGNKLALLLGITSLLCSCAVTGGEAEEQITTTAETTTAGTTITTQAAFTQPAWKDEVRGKGYEYDRDALVYELVWSDEFDYVGEPNPEKWGYDVGGHGWGNNELQYYTEDGNAWVDGEKLIIEARREEKGTRDYTSARLVTRDKGDWLYGKIEVSAKLPAGLGTWPAIWMLPTDWEYGDWPDSGEIDIMEHVGYNLDEIHVTAHTRSYNHGKGTQKGASKHFEGVSEEFYTYAIEWLPDKIVWYVNGEELFTYEPQKMITQPTYREWPFDTRFHLLLNIALGGDWGGLRGFDEDMLPVTMEVDYVRVYQAQFN